MLVGRSQKRSQYVVHFRDNIGRRKVRRGYNICGQKVGRRPTSDLPTSHPHIASKSAQTPVETV